ncbi:hypothetical protein [Rhodobium gokarnense]|uniref:Uncharacterized protein n=1 Tax=Rhodobium gokarnense TaxID=364296 RepID=A0ABT3HGB1_9HYPH|nr:hypothetical protein [Rhodobium gokarnense]MCW2309438.1 hypothetical protein [Rhodobium gokarnense]
MTLLEIDTPPETDVARLPDAAERTEAVAYGVWLARLGRGDLAPSAAPEMIHDAAGRLGLEDVDAYAVATGTAEDGTIRAIEAALDMPPPRAPMVMPAQELGWQPREISVPVLSWRRIRVRAR